MEIKVTDYPNSFLKVTLDKDESIITEKGSFIYGDSNFSSENKIEFKSYKNLIAKIGGKSFSYVSYKAKEHISLVLGTRDNSELMLIKITESNPIMIKADSHFARTSGVELKIVEKKISGLLDGGFWMDVLGTGYLVIKGYGSIIKMDINRQKPLLVEEDSLIAIDKQIDFNIIDTKISDELTQLLKSGVEVPFSINGKGIIYLQSKGRYAIHD